VIDDPFDELLYGIVPDRPAVVYLLPTVLLGVGHVVVGVVVVGELDGIDPGVSATQVLGAVTGLLAGASVVEWLLPTLSRVAER